MSVPEMGITIPGNSGSDDCEFTYLSTFHYFKEKLIVFCRDLKIGFKKTLVLFLTIKKEQMHCFYP
jgi:hypothetical protein